MSEQAIVKHGGHPLLYMLAGIAVYILAVQSLPRYIEPLCRVEQVTYVDSIKK